MKLTKFNSLDGDSPLEKLTKWSNGRPIYTQIKYNGISCRWSFGRNELSSRTGKVWNLDRLPHQLRNRLECLQVNIFGEILIPNTPLPEIAGAVNVNSSEPFPANTFIAVFDAIDPNSAWLAQPISARLNLMAEIDAPKDGLRVVNTWLFPANKADAFFNELPETTEGLVYRRDPCFPVFSGSPHPDIIKRKRIHHAEGICVEVIEGKGKRKGMLGAMVLRLDNGRPLRVGGGAGLTDAVLIDLWNNPPLGKPFTYSYEELSNAGIPLRPQLVTMRDYE